MRDQPPARRRTSGPEQGAAPQEHRDADVAAAFDSEPEGATRRPRGRLLLMPNVLDQAVLAGDPAPTAGRGDAAGGPSGAATDEATDAASRGSPDPAVAAVVAAAHPGPSAFDDPTGSLLDSLPLGAVRLAAQTRHWVAETPKVARAFIKRVEAVVPCPMRLQERQVMELPRPAKGSGGGRGGDRAEAGGGRGVSPAALRTLLRPTMAGEDVALLSDAGLPGVADPGAELVRQAHELGLTVLALAGPSALVMAVAASGLNGQSFAFQGYLPVEAPARAARLRELEALSRRAHQTQVFIETPYRNAAMWQALLATLQPQTLLHVSAGLTGARAYSRTAVVDRWRREAATSKPRGGDAAASVPAGLPGDLPAVFAFLAD